ncbi:MAG TPA: translation initiation factor IF-2 [Solirubrobacteraceae bacterium]|nr:translation initiation factor IF-2 [Solirubrobacteraceae bacterium]
MSKKRVHEIAKEQGMSPKVALARMQAAGMKVGAASSSVDEEAALRALGNGAAQTVEAPATNGGAQGGDAARPNGGQKSPAGAGGGGGGKSRPGAKTAPPQTRSAGEARSAGDGAKRAPAPQAATPSPAPAAASGAPAPTDSRDGAGGAGAGASGAPKAEGDPGYKRPTRDSLQGERAPGAAGGRRRVVIDSQASRRAPGGGPQQQPPRRQRRGRRRRGVYDDEAESRPSQSASAGQPDTVAINSGSTVKDVAEYLGVAVPEVMKKLMALGEMKTLTQTLSDESILVLATELGKEVEIVHSEDEEIAEPVFEDAEADLVERPPVVTIMGHVDHGKTSLLDAIRETEVAKGEAGGITQHIGAYQVHHEDKVVTFLDTPGHEAFTAMRARGAKVTDIAVIVVAADDGVKPQTQEAVDHAKEAGVPVLVAVNKIDKEGAQPDRVRTEMTALALQPVEWGGETEFVDVSAKTKEGLDNLLETILVMAEVEELRANADVEASGTVIESKLDPGRGPVVTILIQRGTLRVYDAFVAGADWGRVRAMHDYMGNRVETATPGEPVEVLGFNGVPEAGEIVRVVDNERRARSLAGDRATRLKTEALARRAGKKISLEDIFKRGLQELNLVLKADVAGSLEAIEDEIAKLPQDEVSVNVIRRAVGAVTESDVMLAAASDAVILAFNVRPVGDARSVAEREGVEIRNYAVIYRAIDELRLAMQGMLEPEQVEDAVGSAEVRQTFRASRVGTIAGCHVIEGKIIRGAKVRLVRDGTVVYDGEIGSLKRFNEDVREVAAGFECGIVLRDFADIKDGDVLETYATRQVERELA